ncbi:MAG: hypothetical protein IKA87_00890 [Lentisphaeria bacterium]|nr:hypothetical protein [Lentisphaeria bacterium]
MSKIPISLIIDDAGPVNMFHFHDLGGKHDLIVPPAFALHFGKICRQYGVKGKFSVVPIPGGLGRLDQPSKVNRVSPEHIEAFVNITKEYILPNFSITSEILTHFQAWDLQRCSNTHLNEDKFVSNASAETIAEYVALSIEILNNMGLDPKGVTSPWATGIDNEENYAKGIGMAFKRALGKDKCFYFLHSRDELKHPVIMYDTPETGKVVSIPNNSEDAFWGTQNPRSFDAARQSAKEKIDSLISEDGRSGKLRELFEENAPLIMISHWQSLYSDGRGIGIEGFEYLIQRVNRVFGSQVEWMNFEELAETARPR